MIFAAGAATHFLEVYYADSRRGVAGALSVIARAVASTVFGGELSRRLFRPLRGEVEVDGERLPEAEWTLLGAANVRDVGLGFRPFLTAGEDPNRVHFVASTASAARLCAELPRLRLGRGRSCLIHRSCRSVVARFEEPQVWTLDADLDAPARRIEVSAGPTVRFLTPDRAPGSSGKSF